MRHRDPTNGQPAIIYANGSREWWRHGARHRDGDLPAVERANGTREWYVARALRGSESAAHAHRWVNGELHRDGGGRRPARVYESGKQEWYEYGKLHRVGDQPAIVWPARGLYEWWTAGRRHRDYNAPAVVSPEAGREYWRDGVRHRDDGRPAIERPDGRREWYVAQLHYMEV